MATEEERGGALGPHPDPEILFAYLAGEVSSEEADRLREHFALCPSCCDRLLALEAYGYERPAEETPVEAGVKAAVWSRIQERIASGASAPMPSSRRTRRSWALAASLLLASIGFSSYVLQHRLEEPRLATIVDLLPDGEAVRGGSIGEVKLSSDSRDVVLVLHTFDARPFSDYKILLTDGERTIWSASGLKPAQDGSIILSIPRVWLSTAAVKLRIELYGQANEKEELIATYSAELE